MNRDRGLLVIPTSGFLLIGVTHFSPRRGQAHVVQRLGRTNSTQLTSKRYASMKKKQASSLLDDGRSGGGGIGEPSRKFSTGVLRMLECAGRPKRDVRYSQPCCLVYASGLVRGVSRSHSVRPAS